MCRLTTSCGLSRGAGKSRVVENRGINGVAERSLSDMRIARLALSDVNDKMRCAAYAVSGSLWWRVRDFGQTLGGLRFCL